MSKQLCTCPNGDWEPDYSGPEPVSRCTRCGLEVPREYLELHHLYVDWVGYGPASQLHLGEHVRAHGLGEMMLHVCHQDYLTYADVYDSVDLEIRLNRFDALLAACGCPSLFEWATACFNELRDDEFFDISARTALEF
jgi:hypothetical protein